MWAFCPHFQFGLGGQIGCGSCCTQISCFWFSRTPEWFDSHFLKVDACACFPSTKLSMTMHGYSVLLFITSLKVIFFLFDVYL